MPVITSEGISAYRTKLESQTRHGDIAMVLFCMRQSLHHFVQSCAVVGAIMTTYAWGDEASPPTSCATLSQESDLRKCGVMLKEPGENESHNGSSDATLLNIMKVKSTVKSYALIISVSDYPHLWKPKLQAAEVDYNNLKDFFSGNQEFDVVVGLRDAMVSEHNIRFILRISSAKTPAS